MDEELTIKMKGRKAEKQIKVPNELTHGPFAVDTGSLMLPVLIIFFLAQPKNQERACFLNV